VSSTAGSRAEPRPDQKYLPGHISGQERQHRPSSSSSSSLLSAAAAAACVASDYPHVQKQRRAFLGEGFDKEVSWRSKRADIGWSSGFRGLPMNPTGRAYFTAGIICNNCIQTSVSGRALSFNWHFWLSHWFCKYMCRPMSMGLQSLSSVRAWMTLSVWAYCNRNCRLIGCSVSSLARRFYCEKNLRKLRPIFLLVIYVCRYHSP